MAVKSSIGLPDLPSAIKKTLSTPNAQVRFVLKVRSRKVMIEGTGAIGLTLSHPTDIVVRKSGFTSDRTLMVKADKAAVDLPRAMVRLLQDPRNRVTIELSAFTGGEQP